jgi:hypothetical protein
LTKSNGTLLKDAVEFGNGLASQAVVQLQSLYGTFFQGIGLGVNQTAYATLQYTDQIGGNGVIFVDAGYISDDTGVQWLAILAAPQQSLIGPYLSAMISVSVVSFLLAILCLVSGVATSLIIVRPLLKLMKEMMLVKEMQLDETDIDSRSSFSEVRYMQGSFSIMVKR